MIDDSRPLRGITVVDATSDFAGRLCGRLLRDAGARVIRFPRSDDATRDVWERYLDLGKEKPASTDLSRAAAGADVLLCTRPEDDGIDIGPLRALDPQLVIVRIPPFGVGPYERFRSDDVVLSALSGLADCTPGYPDRQEGEIQPPVQSLAPLAEFGAGIIATVATLGALMARFRSAAGPKLVEVSQLEAVVSMMIMDWGTAAYGGTAPGRRRNARMLEPNVYVKSVDGYLVIVATSDKHWAALTEAMGSPPWTKDERFATVPARGENIVELHRLLREWAKDHSGRDLMEKVQRQGVPCVGMLDLTDSLRSEQVRLLGSVEVVDGMTLPADPIVLNGRRRADRYARVETSRDAAPPPTQGASAGRPLAGVRILDIAQLVAGPLASQLLVALGAEVLLVESRRRPVPRLYGPFAGKPEYDASSNFNHVNRGKRSVELDLKTTEGRELLATLVRRSDIVLENFSRRAAEELGLTYAALRTLREDVIVASISAFGRSGPWGSYVANHAGVTLLTGLASAIQDPEGRPRLVGAIMPDALTGAYMAAALLQALMLRARTGRGSAIEISMLDVILNTMAGLLTTAAAGQELRPHSARFLETSEPGKYLALSGPAMPPTAVEEVRSMTRAQAMAALQDRGLRAAAVLDMLEVQADPHLNARGSVQMIDHPVAGIRPLQAVPWTYDGRRPYLGAAPVLGSDTDDVMTKVAGLSSDNIVRLRASGVLR